MKVCCLMLHAEICTLVGSFAIDIKEHFSDLNDIAVNSEGKFNAEKLIEIKGKLCNIMQFHSDIKQLIIHFDSFF